MIQINDLSFRYEGGDWALRNINLKIEDGEFVTITGPSGCGKSTLCLSMCGFVPHGFRGEMWGNVSVNGMDTREHGIYELSREIGMVQQDPEGQLCTLKVIDEVAFGPENLLLSREEIGERVSWALEVVGISHLVERNTYTLSGGEKQKVAIASILAMKPRIIILDEPTSNLDPSSTVEVFEAIRSLKERTNMTVIVLEHRLNYFAPLSSRLIVMDEGSIVRDGEPGEVLKEIELLQGLGVRIPFLHYEPVERTRDCDREALLSVENLCFSYGDRRVLSNVNLKVRGGELIGLMGDNGSGKTTLMLNILGILRPSSGEVSFRGEDITGAKVSQLARKIGIIFQNPNHQIFEKTVLKEVMLAPLNFRMDEGESREEAERLLKYHRLWGYKDNYPFGLSYGEKRRLNVASVMIYNPDIIILDEPLVGQDFRNTQDLMRSLREIADRGRSVIMITHDPDIVDMYCDRLVFLKRGGVVVDDEPGGAFLALQEMGEKEYLPQYLGNFVGAN